MMLVTAVTLDNKPFGATFPEGPKLFCGSCPAVAFCLIAAETMLEEMQKMPKEQRSKQPQCGGRKWKLSLSLEAVCVPAGVQSLQSYVWLGLMLTGTETECS